MSLMTQCQSSVAEIWSRRLKLMHGDAAAPTHRSSPTLTCTGFGKLSLVHSVFYFRKKEPLTETQNMDAAVMNTELVLTCTGSGNFLTHQLTCPQNSSNNEEQHSVGPLNLSSPIILGSRNGREQASIQFTPSQSLDQNLRSTRSGFEDKGTRRHFSKQTLDVKIDTKVMQASAVLTEKETSVCVFVSPGEAITRLERNPPPKLTVIHASVC
ncbi:hypothetical protein BaRGS_00021024 [Batillaria attramentaria]|uniref:Uncharacterized protein n=1 Tax=Batillaria attramentaria TaxID=370345 RepID=A0ABD0KKW9_9CAEN